MLESEKEVQLLFSHGAMFLIISLWLSIILTMYYCTMTIIEEIRKIKKDI